MNTTIVFAHPYEGSFNKAVLDAAQEGLRAAGDQVEVIDLYREGFNPVLSQADLALYGQGKTTDPLVEKYNAILDRTEKIVFVFPVWWYDMPAILRGFFDKVMLAGSAFSDGPKGIYPLRNIAHTRVITTSAATDEDLVGRFGDPINGTIIGATFAMVGFNNARWMNLGAMSTATEEARKAFLEKVKGWV